MGMGMGPQISHPEPVDSEEALMAKAIEDSLALNSQPAANFDEDAELARILEMSKN